MNVFDKFIDFIIAIVLMFIFPIIYLNQKSDLMSYQRMLDQTIAFVDNISELGKLTQERYNCFYQEIYTMEHRFELDMSYEDIIHEPEYIKDADGENYHFTGNVMTYSLLTSNEEIISLIYNKNEDFSMNKGGYFQVTIRFPKEEHQMIIYGGAIR